MKVSEAIFRNRLIYANTEHEFEAVYKRHRITISDDHGFGEAEYKHLTRFNIVVEHEDGGLVVDSIEDFHEIRDAIRHALRGAMLIDPGLR